MPTLQRSRRPVNWPMRIGIVLVIVALLAWAFGFVVTLVIITQTANLPRPPPDRVELAFRVTSVAVVVALPSGLLGIGLLVTALIKSWMAKQRRDSRSGIP